MKRVSYLALAGAFALAACGGGAEDTQGTDPNADMAANNGTTDTMTDPAASAETPGSPQEFVSMAAASDMFEIESARLAQEMASSQEVKDFAAMMIEDHSTSTENLRAAAAEAQPAVTVSPQLSAAQQAQIDELRQAGDGFDARYKEQQVAAHERALALLQGYANSDGPEPLRTYARDTAGVVEQHLDHARGLSVE